MSEGSIFKTPGPYHIISYGTLLGTQFFQSFVGGIVAYRALSRPQFSQLQQKIFPIYFGLQTALPAIVALTYPGSKLLLGTSSSLKGAFAEVNRWSVLAPLATVFVCGLLNLGIFGPATTKVMKERKHQETRDGKKYFDPAPHSEEMVRLNKQFGTMHGVSTLVNLAGFIATLWYGVSLAARLE